MLENLGLNKQWRHLDRGSKESEAPDISKVSGPRGTTNFAYFCSTESRATGNPRSMGVPTKECPKLSLKGTDWESEERGRISHGGGSSVRVGEDTFDHVTAFLHPVLKENKACTQAQRGACVTMK